MEKKPNSREIERFSKIAQMADDFKEVILFYEHTPWHSSTSYRRTNLTLSEDM